MCFGWFWVGVGVDVGVGVICDVLIVIGVIG